jgi:hypothetical protein
MVTVLPSYLAVSDLMSLILVTLIQPAAVTKIIASTDIIISFNNVPVLLEVVNIFFIYPPYYFAKY